MSDFMTLEKCQYGHIALAAALILCINATMAKSLKCCSKMISYFRPLDQQKNRLKYISFYTISICYHFESKTYFYWQIESYCTFERMIKGLNFGPYFKIPSIVMRPLLSK